MKIVILYNIFSPYRIDLFDYLSKMDEYDITVLYLQKLEDNRQWEIDENNIKHKYLILNTKTFKLKQKLNVKYIHFPMNIKEVLNRINPDVVIGYGYNPTVFLSFRWAKRNNKRYISWTDGTLNSEKEINIIQKYLRKKICKNSDALIASSTKAKEAQICYGADKRRIFISYLTVDINKYMVERQCHNNNTILYVGSLIKLKGIDLLINALKDIKLPYKLVLVGAGNQEKWLKEYASKIGIIDNMEFCGFKQRDEIVKYYADADIFILPTRQDCFGLVITEAMCAGLPVVVSKYADGAYDLVDDGENGFIVDPYDSKTLKEKIEFLLSNSDAIREMGRSSQEKVKKFGIEDVSKGFIEAIEYVR